MPYIVDKDAFKAIIASIVPDSIVEWEGDPNSFIGDTQRSRVGLEFFSVLSNGVDEHRRHISDGVTDGFATGSYVTDELGNRTVHITFLAQAFDKSVESTEIIDIIKTAIRREDVRDQLNAIRLAFSIANGAVRLRKQVDNRVVNSCVCDFVFLGIAHQQHFIPPGAGGDYINTLDSLDDGQTNGPIPGELDT